MTALSLVPPQPLSPVVKSWQAGVIEGRSCAAWLGTRMQDHALARVAVARADAVRAESLLDAIGNWPGGTLDERRQRAWSSGLMHAYEEDTAHRRDAEDCANCGLRVCTDVEDSWRCPAGEHGVTCCEECRDYRCRFPKCADQL